VRPRSALAALALLAAAACGYGFSGARRPEGVERVTVHLFQNRSAEPELGAEVTSALRRELARAAGEGEGNAFIEGDVGATEPIPSTASSFTLRIALEVRARLVVGGTVRAEHALRREVDYLAGVDALETEGRRALALRRAAEEIAPDVLGAFGW
jgi:hypothetical protein